MRKLIPALIFTIIVMVCQSATASSVEVTVKTTTYVRITVRDFQPCTAQPYHFSEGFRAGVMVCIPETEDGCLPDYDDFVVHEVGTYYREHYVGCQTYRQN